MLFRSMFKRLLHLWFLVSRPMTLGVRLLVENETGEILLVRHTYVDGWHLPGGGVDPGETLEQAAIRELSEETGIETEPPLVLLGMYFNADASRRDHVALFRAAECRQASVFEAGREIADMRFFTLNDLPEDVTAATRRRLSEIYGEKSGSIHW